MASADQARAVREVELTVPHGRFTDMYRIPRVSDLVGTVNVASPGGGVKTTGERGPKPSRANCDVLPTVQIGTGDPAELIRDRRRVERGGPTALTPSDPIRSDLGGWSA
jgi:hypothetical protein